jgi:hypothetical protein
MRTVYSVRVIARQNGGFELKNADAHISLNLIVTGRCNHRDYKPQRHANFGIRILPIAPTNLEIKVDDLDRLSIAINNKLQTILPDSQHSLPSQQFTLQFSKCDPQSLMFWLLQPQFPVPKILVVYHASLN